MSERQPIPSDSTSQTAEQKRRINNNKEGGESGFKNELYIKQLLQDSLYQIIYEDIRLCMLIRLCHLPNCPVASEREEKTLFSLKTCT